MPSHDYPIFGHREVAFTVDLDDENLTVLADIRPHDKRAILFQVLNGAVALDQFKISARSTVDAQFVVWYATSTDYTTLEGPLQGTSGDLTILPASDEGWFLLYPKGAETIRIEIARAAGANTTVTAEVGLD